MTTLSTRHPYNVEQHTDVKHHKKKTNGAFYHFSQFFFLFTIVVKKIIIIHLHICCNTSQTYIDTKYKKTRIRESTHHINFRQCKLLYGTLHRRDQKREDEVYRKLIRTNY